MLDRGKVMKELSIGGKQLFLDYSQEYEAARLAWQKACVDSLFIDKVRAYPSYNLATWCGQVGDVFPVRAVGMPYNLVSVDGSQIYPDKHQGISCFLINIGTAVFRYGRNQATTFFSSEPFLFAGQDDGDETERSVDVVNGKREEFEFKIGLETCAALQEQEPKTPLLFLFDGSLIFWHLESKEQLLKQYFLQSYCKLLQGFYERKIPIIGYISLPKSKDLVNLVRAHATEFFPVTTERTQLFTHTVDTIIASFFLQDGQRSTFFESHTSITQGYPAHLRPWFCYYVTPEEIVRLEFPRYMLDDDRLLEQSLSIVADQVFKGNGYPISTAEAHIQAVVRGADRDFFYQAIERYGIQCRQRLIMSQKSLKKRRMSV